ncbi:MAG TPA: protein phosphatase 2C domain-containing protein [Candidatus Binatia bacterium]|nr:protein phosphatase 2C domain-containing protein [Candidatus Binatia bacterium]
MPHFLERYILGLFDRESRESNLSGKPENVTKDTNEPQKQGETELEYHLDDVAEAHEPPEAITQELVESPAHLAAAEKQSSNLSGEPRLEVASRSHVGNVRQRNEDSYFCFLSQAGGTEPPPLFGLFIVADGMGGHNDGHRASKLVARTVAQHVLDRLYRSLLQDTHSAMQQPVQEAMEEAVLLANQALAGAESGKEMGTTLTAAVVIGSRLFLVHIGDSRAYLMHDGKLSLVTTDHTFVQALQDAGQLTAEEAAIHPNRNLLYRALMGEEMEQPVDVFTRSLPHRGTLMLCSDGLWGSVAESTISAILRSDNVLQEKADRLQEAALKAGGSDNITVILASFAL